MLRQAQHRIKEDNARLKMQTETLTQNILELRAELNNKLESLSASNEELKRDYEKVKSELEDKEYHIEQLKSQVKSMSMENLNLNSKLGRTLLKLTLRRSAQIS